jgi:hypothetical protein
MPAREREPVPEDPPEVEVPDTLIEAIRWDVIVLLLALLALGANLLFPDELSSALLVFLGLAVLWVGYRIVVNVRAFRSRG